ncbi:diacylglycerol/lipid kinase family protein [Ornithinibacillus halophilus]|uniref:Lipid kinase, YegS/Rv2252/BmrU family n=1 Tax=Ornithinibacillus halophilus TaxID=930117 RepID=A0A1M5EMM6_9BACI|nr:YegS/Rv2252/BmrU family lipid kinase [Ornithinibacillus halophilus]SHF80533.1 lipid kinase, YegS/Rv2252/BmrU family [Ornithinibacillus halophilus]
MIIFIVNPAAGHGRGKRIYTKIKKSTIYQEVQSKVYFTEYPNHAEELATEISKQNLENLIAVVVIGGDGTLHEVMNGIDPLINVAFIPGGSGNDFARGSKIKGNPIEILRRVIEEHSTDYWLGKYSIEGDKPRQFVNSIGFGFDAAIADQANRAVYKKLLNKLHIGTVSYVFALIQVLFHFKPFHAELVLDGKKYIIDDCWMVTITNHAYYGGGMKIIPTAKIQPNNFSVLIVDKISKWKILGLFLTVFSGKHVSFKEVNVYQAKDIMFRAQRDVSYQVDGQTFKGKQGYVTKHQENVRILGTINK